MYSRSNQMSRKEYKDKFNDFGTIGKMKQQNQLKNRVDSQTSFENLRKPEEKNVPEKTVTIKEPNTKDMLRSQSNFESKSFDLRPSSKMNTNMSSRPYETGISERGIILNNNKTDRVKQTQNLT